MVGIKQRPSAARSFVQHRLLGPSASVGLSPIVGAVGAAKHDVDLPVVVDVAPQRRGAVRFQRMLGNGREPPGPTSVYTKEGAADGDVRPAIVVDVGAGDDIRWPEGDGLSFAKERAVGFARRR